MKLYFLKKNLIIIIFYVLIFTTLLNIFFGNKNVFVLKELDYESEKLFEDLINIEKELARISFLNSEFKNNNRDLQEIILRQELNYKERGDIVIIND